MECVSSPSIRSSIRAHAQLRLASLNYRSQQESGAPGSESLDAFSKRVLEAQQLLKDPKHPEKAAVTGWSHRLHGRNDLPRLRNRHRQAATRKRAALMCSQCALLRKRRKPTRLSGLRLGQSPQPKLSAEPFQTSGGQLHPNQLFSASTAPSTPLFRSMRITTSTPARARASTNSSSQW